MFEITNTATAEMTAEMKNPRLIAFMPCSSSLRGATARIPMIEVIDADRAHEQREHHAGDRADRRAAVRRRAQDQRGHQRDLVGLEQVGRHARAVADVVADVVGDRRGVARVVLGDALLDLAHEVGAHVGRLREDAAAHPHEHREQRATEPEAHQHARGVLLVDQQDHGRAEQAEAHREHPGHTAGAERDPHGLPQTRFARGVRRADVGPNGEPHPDVAGRRAEHRAQDERERAPELDRELRVHRVLRCRQDEEQDHGQDAQEDRRASGTGARGRPSRPPGSPWRSPSSSRCPPGAPSTSRTR